MYRMVGRFKLNRWSRRREKGKIKFHVVEKSENEKNKVKIQTIIPVSVSCARIPPTSYE